MSQQDRRVLYLYMTLLVASIIPAVISGTFAFYYEPSYGNMPKEQSYHPKPADMEALERVLLLFWRKINTLEENQQKMLELLESEHADAASP